MLGASLLELMGVWLDGNYGVVLLQPNIHFVAEENFSSFFGDFNNSSFIANRRETSFGADYRKQFG